MQLKDASTALESALTKSAMSTGQIAINTGRWTDLTSEASIKSPAASAALANSDPLETLGVNFDNGMSHKEDVQRIVKTGTRLTSSCRQSCLLLT